MKPSGGRLPDPAALTRGLEELRLGARLRGIEAEIDGWLVRVGGDLLLVVAGTGETVRLAPLRGKIHWDVEADRQQPSSAAEREAYARLNAGRQRQFQPARVIGPLIAAADGGYSTVEVRQFTYQR